MTKAIGVRHDWRRLKDECTDSFFLGIIKRIKGKLNQYTIICRKVKNIYVSIYFDSEVSLPSIIILEIVFLLDFNNSTKYGSNLSVIIHRNLSINMHRKNIEILKNKAIIKK